MRIWTRIVPVALAMVLSFGCAQMPTGPSSATWRLLPGRVESLQLPAFRNGRQCWVYLPPGYGHSNQRYPVLYLNDGEFSFDSPGGMHVNRICEDLIRRGEIEAIIVVGIENGPGPARNIDYTPWPTGFFAEDGGGDFYIRAIRDTLKPEIDKRYRTLSGSANTAIAGYSLGGLISVYAAYTYDSTFGKVASFSASYWWSGFSQYVQTRGRPRGLIRFYQDTGTDDNSIGVIERIAIEQGFTLGTNFMSYVAQGGEHGAAWWGHRFPDMLRFLFPREVPAGYRRGAPGNPFHDPAHPF
jgi:predicted alpha/beta superfamily hydrolase